MTILLRNISIAYQCIIIQDVGILIYYVSSFTVVREFYLLQGEVYAPQYLSINYYMIIIITLCKQRDMLLFVYVYKKNYYNL